MVDFMDKDSLGEGVFLVYKEVCGGFCLLVVFTLIFGLEVALILIDASLCVGIFGDTMDLDVLRILLFML